MSSDQLKPIAFIIPRYVDSTAGGAETACRHFAEKLKSMKGIPTEILTTCAESNTAWENVKAPGVRKINDIPVHFFPVDERENPERYLSTLFRLDDKKELSQEEEEFFFNNNVNSRKLYEFIKENQNKYAFFVFTPYLFGTTVNGAKVCPQKTLIRPCFHNESYARMRPVPRMLQSVKGIICNSPPEKDLILRLGQIPDSKVFLVGEGVETVSVAADEKLLEQINVKQPFIFYFGRQT